MDAFDSLKAIFEANHCDWVKGLSFHEPTRSALPREMIAGRHHEIATQLFPEMVREAVCPPTTRQGAIFYSHARAQERFDLNSAASF